MSLSRGLRVLHKQGPPYSVLLESRQLEDGILLESGNVVSLTPSEKDEIKGDYVKAADAYGCLGVMKFSRDHAGDAPSLYLVLVTACMPVGKLLSSEIFRITGASFFSLQNGSVDSDSRCTDVKKLLSSGKFYFAWSGQAKSGKSDTKALDLTVSLQNQDKKGEDHRFFWNHLLHLHFKHYGADCANWLFKVMSGGIDIRTVYVGAQQAKAAVISRLSCERAGTRFNVRGVDDEGHVANFVESEQLIIVGNSISSFMQVRGSVPLFWEQPGLNVGSHKVKMARGFEASAPTYERHFSSLIDDYGQCLVVNLLGSKEGEKILSGLYQQHHESSVFSKEIPMVCFDYHAECRGGKWENLSKLKSKIWKEVEGHGSYTYKDEENLCIRQTGVVRVNCLDCLDRTNSTETYFGMHMVIEQLKNLGLSGNKQLEDRFKEAFKAAWPVTGDLISRMYAGTGALEGKTKIKDGARSVSRAIQNNFLDQNKQNAIDLLILGNNSTDAELAARADNLLSGDCLQAPTAVLRGMCENFRDYTSPMSVRVSIGTWNVNGGKHFRSIAYKDQTLDDWLLNGHKPSNLSNTLYKALYDFAGAEEDDLSFVSGDIITDAELLEDSEWLSGTCNGMTGIFPLSYVTKVLPKYTALFDFPAQQEGDLAFSAGDIIEVTEMTGEWWKGKVIKEEYNPNELEGNFPANFVEMSKQGQDDVTVYAQEHKDSSTVDWNKAMDIYVIGFQEMVELSAGNIVNTSHSNQHAWGIELQKTISKEYKYVLVASEQLVGVCLYVFVRPHHAPHIRDVEIATVKTGMGGATGNKGAIGIRMQFHNSSLCFVCSHLAAGQGQVQDRNNDFAEICKKMVFTANKSIFLHDYVFWCGDLNYRIDMPIDDVKELVKNQEWGPLKTNDQLCVERGEGRVFNGFREGETDFAPTYKYDLFSDDYDTSDKSRTPAWTDRVLWLRRKWFTEQQKQGSLVSVSEEPDWNMGSLIYYGRAELKTSDHRPVIAVLDVDILQSDDDHLDATFHKVVSAQGPADASVLVSLTKDEGSGDIPLSGDFFDALMTKFRNLGEVTLTRHFKGKLLVIFSNGSTALKAMSVNGTFINGNEIFVSLKTSGWEQEIEHEIRHRSHSEPLQDSPIGETHSREHETTDYHLDYSQDREREYEQNYKYSSQVASDNFHEAGEYSPEVETTAHQYEEDVSEQFEDINDPGWAYAGEANYPDITVPAPETIKAKPPRPSTGPIKKRAPPRPDTLPTFSEPPALPSKPPSLTPGPPAKTPPSRPPAISPPSLPAGPSILIPEPAPLPVKPPKVMPRTTIPKRRAPAPPPGKVKSLTVKSKSPAPPLPITPPKGPSRNFREHTNNAYIPENHSAPSLLDLDPFGSTSMFQSTEPKSTPVLQPHPSIPFTPVPSTGLSPPIIPRRSSAGVLSGSSKSSVNAWQPSMLQPAQPGLNLVGNMGLQTSHNQSILPVQHGIPQTQPRPRNPNYKPMVPMKPTQASIPTAFAGNTLLQPTVIPLKPTIATKPISNGGSRPAVPQCSKDMFSFFDAQQYNTSVKPPTPQSAPTNDPWGVGGAVDKNANDITNSFSTDFSKLTFN